MAINNYHIVEEIAGVRCAVVEKGISSERALFLRGILENSGQQVYIEGDEFTGFSIGVEDIRFNVLYALYGKSLRLPNGNLVTPSIWYQRQQTGDYYWEYK